MRTVWERARRSLLAGMAIPLLTSATAFATEGGGGAYSNGAENFFAGALPPPGTYFIDYAAYYTSSKFRDKDGNSAIPGFKLDVAANAFRVLHVSNVQLLGGNWVMHATVPVLKVDVSVPGLSQSKSGLGDLILDPFAIAWHTKNFHAVAALETFVPVGNYNKTDLVNLSRNYWTFEPMFAGTYFTDHGFEISGKLHYDINTKNTATNYRSGQELHLDYTFAQSFGNLSVGLGGYYYKQVTDDKLAGVKVGTDGNRGQVFAWGPVARYQYNKLSFVAAIQSETQARNKPEGNKFWIKAYVPF